MILYGPSAAHAMSYFFCLLHPLIGRPHNAELLVTYQPIAEDGTSFLARHLSAAQSVRFLLRETRRLPRCELSTQASRRNRNEYLRALVIPSFSGSVSLSSHVRLLRTLSNSIENGMELRSRLLGM